MPLIQVFQKLGIALGLGLLVGLERERMDSLLAGFRTFPLVTILGTLSALLARDVGGWVVALGLLAVASLLVVGNIVQLRAGKADPGLTTEMAMLVMYGVGAYLVVGHTGVAVALGAGTAVLLHMKERLHGLAGRLGEDDFHAILRFALISLVILPALPDRTYGPYAVLNPNQIWLMVVLIVGIGLGGYVAYKLFGDRAGTLLSGLLGGLISSTATTVSYARQSREAPGLARTAALVVIIASAVVFARVLFEIAVVAPSALAQLGPPLGIMMGTLALLGAALWLFGPGRPDSMPSQRNPSQLKAAMVFGLLYAVILLAVAAAKDTLGQRGLYAVSVLSGLSDMDAITLSTAQLVHTNRLDAATGWRVILLASLSNLVFKGATVVVLGHRRMSLTVGALFAVALGVGLGLFLLWP